MRLVLDWDGTVTERDTLHMTIERFGDLQVFREMEARIGRELTLNEVIGIEMATISAPFGEVLAWLLDVGHRAARLRRARRRARPADRLGRVSRVDRAGARARRHRRAPSSRTRSSPARTGGGQRSSSGTPVRSAASPASASRSPTTARSSTSATASPTAAPRSRPIASSPATASPAGSTSRVRPMRRFDDLHDVRLALLSPEDDTTS